MAQKKTNLLVDHFLGEMVIITAIQNDTSALFQGMLVDIDDKFIFIDRALDGIIDCGIAINNILSIELYTEEEVVEDLNGIIHDLDVVMKKEKKGNIQ